MANDLPPDLVIFDCDGVLVDSEPLGCAAMVRKLAALGLHITHEAAMALFRGRRMADSIAVAERHFGTPLPASFVPELRAETAAALRTGLRPIDGIAAALGRIDRQICVASNGPRDQIELSLTLTGLIARFAGRIFSAYEVGSWKPDPGLFLFAARTVGATPARCVVVEDSLPGVQAAVAAGMRVMAYAGDRPGDELAEAGGRVFRTMTDLPRLLGLERQAVPA